MLGYNLISEEILDYLEKEYGKQRSLKYFSKIIEIMDTAAQDWDNCKTLDENLSKLIGDLTQMLAVDVASSKANKNAKQLVSIVEALLEDKGISLGNLTQNLYDLSQEVETYLKERSEVAKKLKDDYEKLDDEAKARLLEQGIHPNLPGWNTKINEIQDALRQKFNSAVKDLFPYSQISWNRLQNFAHENGTTLDNIVRTNNLLSTRDGNYYLVPENKNLKLPNGDAVPFDFVCDIKNKIISFSISNPTVYETDGKIEFTINLNRGLEKDLTLKLSTIDGSATGDEDFEKIKDKKIIIKSGNTSQKFSIKIAQDGKYEGKEEFMLKAMYEKDSYKGDDLKEVINPIIMATGTILDFPQEECPKPQIPNFGFSFHTPTTKHISGGDNSYSSGGWSGSGGGGWGGRSGGGWGSSSIVYTPTTPSKKSLPYIPEYECYYDPELNSVLKVKLPSNLNTKNGNQTNNELNFTSSNNSNNTSTLRNFSKNLSTSTINSLNLINSKDLKQTDLNTTQTIKSSNNLDDNNQPNTLNLKKSNTPSNNPNPKQTKLYFDMNSDGFKERMLNWLSDDEAILINDINNNGLVDSGLEIIGNNYKINLVY